MKKHVPFLMAIFLACFCFLQILGNQIQSSLFLNGHAAFQELSKLQPLSSNSHSLPASATLDIETLDENDTQDYLRTGNNDSIIYDPVSEIDHCYFTKLRLSAQQTKIVAKQRLPFFILYHSWKSHIS